MAQATPKSLSKKPFAPKILTGNDLLVGEVVFLAPGGRWIRDAHHARVARSPDAAEALLDLGHDAEAANRIVGAYLVDVETDPDGLPRPIHYRERIRVHGPTERPVPHFGA